MQKMTLLWTVGSRATFSEHGGVAVATRQKGQESMPAYVRTVQVLAKVCGLAHDLGKMNAFFQEKISLDSKGKPKYPWKIGDPVRHEWLSGLLLEDVWNAGSVELSNRLQRNKRPERPLESCLKGRNPKEWGAFDAVRWGVITHHHMMRGNAGSNVDHFDHWRLQDFSVLKHCPIKKEPDKQRLVDTFRKDKVFEKYQNGDIPQSVLDAIQKGRDFLLEHPLEDWRGAAIIARAALTWGDHYWSSQKQENPDDGEVLRANSQSRQSLRVHLFGVAGHAQKIAGAYLDPDGFSGVSPQSMESIVQPADSDSRFAWQNVAADFLSALPQGQPTLVLNMAGTGSGKTRANMRCLAALLPEGRPFRVTSVFNLRSLTTQTGQAYRDGLGIEENDLSCIVGDPFLREADEVERFGRIEDGEGPEDGRQIDEDDFEYAVEGSEAHRIPAWLERMRGFDRTLIPLLTPPVLVSTIDYVIAAGDFGKMRRHAPALMRIAHSDLILDEIDGYDPAALASVCRVVLMAGLFGRHVVASSATLSKPVADAIQRAYSSGCAMRSGMLGEPVSPRYVFVDDRNAPSLADDGGFHATYEAHVDALVASVSASAALRRYRALPASSQNIEDWADAIDAESARLHADHHFDWDGVRVSVGLVRLANVRPCVLIARNLADRQDDGLMVSSYHASDTILRRAMKEQWLDRVLTRNDREDPHAHIRNNAEMRAAHARALAAGKQDLRFVVVATPVEEIGRDHDFDWAIIEPSSAQSIVQTAGRVNRHRMIPVETPNVVVFDRNRRSFKKDSRTGGRCFMYPGYEVESVSVYTNHDMEHLLGMEDGAPIHAGWRIGTSRTPFAIEDDRAIGEYLRDGMAYLDKPWAWHTAFFEKYALRKRDGVYPRVFRCSNSERQIYGVQSGKEDKDPYSHGDVVGTETRYAFFCPILDDENISDAEKVGMRFSVFMGSFENNVCFDLHFGGYRQ